MHGSKKRFFLFFPSAVVALVAGSASALVACSNDDSPAAGGVAGVARGGSAGMASGGASGAAAELPTSTPIAAITFDALFVVNGGDHSLSVINTETNELAGTVAFANANYPHHVTMSRDKSRLLVAVPGMDFSMGHDHHGAHGGHDAMPGAVMMLDATTGATIQSVFTPMMNHNAVFSPDGSEIWTAQIMSPGSVLRLDATTLATVGSIEVGDIPQEVTLSADGARAFVANNGSKSVSVVDMTTKEVIKTVPVDAGPVGAWQGSNGVAYVDNETAKTLTAIDTKTLEVKLTYDLKFTPGMAAFGPDGHVWVTDGDNGKVVRKMEEVDMTMGEVTTGAGAHGVTFSGDGKSAYVTNQMANTLTVIDVATQTAVKTISVGEKPNGLVWRAK